MEKGHFRPQDSETPQPIQLQRPLALALEGRPWHKSSRSLIWLIPVFSCQTQRISYHCHFC